VIDERVGRRIRIGDRWLADFASSSYLGFDLDPEILEAVPRYHAAWGTHPGRPRLFGSPAPFERIERDLSALLGAEDALLMPTTTHIHTSVIPVLAGSGVVFLDGRARKPIYDGAVIARSHGATVLRYRHGDPEHLEELLRSARGRPRIVAMEGVHSMNGNAPDVRAFASLAREHDAGLYLDDSHGFGVVGERGSDELCEWGKRGNGVIRHQGERYENVVLVAGLSCAYASMLAFLALPTKLKDVLKVAAPPYLYSGPPPVASLATAAAGLEVNARRGDLYRYEAFRKTQRVLDRLHDLDVGTPNRSGYPLIHVPLARGEDLDPAGRFLFERGVYAMIAAYPLVPRDEVGFRVQVTAANADCEVDQLCEVLGELRERFELRREPRHEPPVRRRRVGA
jgi:8-amino-7-oxononanoate synthase